MALKGKVELTRLSNDWQDIVRNLATSIVTVLIASKVFCKGKVWLQCYTMCGTRHMQGSSLKTKEMN